MSIRALDQFDAFFTDLYDACEEMDIPADTAISEAGLGQFEINLMHGDDALRAADDAWLFKMLVKGLARRHGFAASFMAKPYEDYPGSGLHTHFSVLDENGRNIFDDGGRRGTDALRHAVAGASRRCTTATLIFAPHLNSYDRLVPGAHAPTGICWAYENRTSAIRIPSGNPKARRIEHRVAGGDVNPYLHARRDPRRGAERDRGRAWSRPSRSPATPTRRSCRRSRATGPRRSTPSRRSELMPRILPAELIRNLLLTKRQEVLLHGTSSSPAEQVRSTSTRSERWRGRERCVPRPAPDAGSERPLARPCPSV